MPKGHETKLFYNSGLYITGEFKARRYIAKCAQDITNLGYVVTSNWFNHVEPSYNNPIKVLEAMANLCKSDVIIAIGRVSKRVCWELGFAAAMGLNRVLVNDQVTNFYVDSLPMDKYNNWDECLRAYMNLAKLQFKKGRQTERNRRETEFLT